MIVASGFVRTESFQERQEQKALQKEVLKYKKERAAFAAARKKRKTKKRNK